MVILASPLKISEKIAVKHKAYNQYLKGLAVLTKPITQQYVKLLCIPKMRENPAVSWVDASLKAEKKRGVGGVMIKGNVQVAKSKAKVKV